MLINKREGVDLKHYNHAKGFIEYWNDKDDIYKNIEEYNPNKELKILIVFDDMMPDMISNKKQSNSNWTVYQRRKSKHFSCFYYTILFFCTKKSWTKFCTLFYYKNYKQMRAPINHI